MSPFLLTPSTFLLLSVESVRELRIEGIKTRIPLDSNFILMFTTILW